jgi:hypothetical protein
VAPGDPAAPARLTSQKVYAPTPNVDVTFTINCPVETLYEVTVPIM